MMFRLKIEPIAKEILDIQFKKYPQLKEIYTPSMIATCFEDICHHLSYLNQALLVDSKILFESYISWIRGVLEARNVPSEQLQNNLVIISQVLSKHLDDKEFKQLEEYIELGLEVLRNDQVATESCISQNNPQSAVAFSYLEKILAGNRRDAIKVIDDALKTNLNLEDVYLNILEPVQHEIGRLWQENKISVAKEHYCTAITQTIISRQYEKIFSKDRTGKKLVAACIGGELHEMGIRMVADFFELAGWRTYYLGANVPSESIIDAIKEYKANLVALSATMFIHLEPLKELIEEIRNSGLKNVRIIVGGHPFNTDRTLCKKIGADGCAKSARDAVILGNELV